MKPCFFKPNDEADAAQSFERRMAAKLLNALRAKKRSVPSASLSRWTVDMAKLVRTYGEDRVQFVLEWYLQDLDRPNVRKIRSAGAFADMFGKFENEMRMSFGTCRMPSEAREVLNAVRAFDWPAGFDQELPMVIQISLENYTAFRNDVKRARDRLRKEMDDLAASTPYCVADDGVVVLKNGKTPKTADDVRRRLNRLSNVYQFACNVLRQHLTSPVVFIERWMTQVWVMVHDWSGYSGTLSTLVFVPTSPRLCRMGRTWAHAFYHSSRLWDELMDRVRRSV